MQVLMSENFSKFRRVGTDIYYGKNTQMESKDIFSKYSSLIFKITF